MSDFIDNPLGRLRENPTICEAMAEWARLVARTIIASAEAEGHLGILPLDRAMPIMLATVDRLIRETIPWNMGSSSTDAHEDEYAVSVCQNGARGVFAELERHMAKPGAGFFTPELARIGAEFGVRTIDTTGQGSLNLT